MGTRNIFTATGRYAHRQGENFLTESLAFVLEMLGEHEPVALQALLSSIANQSLLIDPKNLAVTTQESTDLGRPDLVISQKLDFVLFIEIKDRSGLGMQQLERYHQELQKRAEGEKHLILLTRSKWSARNVMLDSREYKHILWHQVVRWLANLSLTDEMPQYLVAQYISFLEESRMNLLKVEDYSHGVRNMHRMVELIRSALEEALPGEKLAYTNPLQTPYVGYYWQLEKHWIGFYFDNPAMLCIEKGGQDKPRPKLFLDLNGAGFFDLESGEQLDSLIQFINRGIQELEIPRRPAQ